MKKRYQLVFAAAVMLFFSNSFADECDSVGYLLEKGQYSSASLILDPLVKKGVSCAQYYKGLMYVEGYGVTTNEEKGIALIKAAQAKGYPEAEKFLSSYH